MGNEELNRDEKAIADMLGTLPRVGVPGDFDFRVKARIAQGVPAVSGRSWLMSISRFAVPVVLLLVVGGYFGYRSMDASTHEVNVANEAKPASIAPIVETAVNTASVEPSKEVIAELAPVKPKEVDPAVNSAVPNSIVPVSNSANIRGGSIERGLGTSRSVYPRGTDPNAKPPVMPKEFNQPGIVSAKDVLDLLGVEVVYSENGWRVAKVVENSTAQRAGLKTGDVVEAINDQPVGEKTTFKGRLTTKSMRVKRDDKSVEVDLQKP